MFIYDNNYDDYEVSFFPIITHDTKINYHGKIIDPKPFTFCLPQHNYPKKIENIKVKVTIKRSKRQPLPEPKYPLANN